MSRCCGYCHMQGHNRRTCEKKALAVQEFYNGRAKVRQHILQEMKKFGVGIGTILKERDEYYFVTSVLWDKLGNGIASSVLEIQYLGYDSEYRFRILLPKEISGFSSTSVHSPVNPETIGKNLSQEWFDGVSGDLPYHLK